MNGTGDCGEVEERRGEHQVWISCSAVLCGLYPHGLGLAKSRNVQYSVQQSLIEKAKKVDDEGHVNSCCCSLCIVHGYTDKGHEIDQTRLCRRL